MKTLFDLCVPRKDVLQGQIKESDFAADLALVLDRKAPDEYQKPDVFFANTHPTQGLKALLKNVCLRLSGTGGEAASIFRLDTQYGGGKTHALIALAHAAGGMKGVANVGEFLEPRLVPHGNVRIAAFDGENADPVNGRTLGHGLRAFTPWGEIAYRLAGVEGYERVRQSDIERIAPGADTLRELFGGEPTLILLDELSVYLRAVHGRSEERQLTRFLTNLFKAVESSPKAALVFTLAIGKGGKAVDAYSQENEYVAAQLAEAESVAARKATLIDPTAEHETAQVLRRRLFASIDDTGAAEVVDAYRALWDKHRAELPPTRTHEDRVAELRAGYPFHPALLSVLTDKVSTLDNFQRVRGMLRLLAKTVARLYAQRPPQTYAVHLHHLDPGYEPIRSEIVTRLGMGSYDPAIRNDVASYQGGVSLAQELDTKDYAGLAPYGSLVARTILWHSFAFNDQLKGASQEELRYAILAPDLELGFVNDARQKFIATSAYLDDRPTAPLRFLTEANLTQIVRRQEQQVDPNEARNLLRDKIREIFSGKELDLVLFPSGPYDVGDDIGDERPRLVLLSYDAESVPADVLKIPDLVDRIYRFKGANNDFRSLANNLVFLVADDAQKDAMRARMVRRLALEAMKHPERLKDLAPHQQERVNELYQRSEQELALAIQQCYRHLFFPSRNSQVEGATVDLGHAVFDVQSASERPGDGQQQVLRCLSDNNKLLRATDQPLRPAYVRDQTPLRRGEIATAELRNEFRKDPRLQLMLGDENFLQMVKLGIDQNVFIYRSGDLLWGQGDPPAVVKIDFSSFLYTLQYATEHGIWPRPAPAPTVPGTPGNKGPGGAPPTLWPSGSVPASGGSASTAAASTPGPAATPTFTAEAPLREALTRIWQDARAAKVERLAWLSLRVFDWQDAFRLLNVVNAVPGAQKKATLSAEYETTEGSTFKLEYEGHLADALPIKDFLEPQLRAAKDKMVNSTYTLTFADGLSLKADEPEKLTERLVRFAAGAALVEAVAEAKP